MNVSKDKAGAITVAQRQLVDTMTAPEDKVDAIVIGATKLQESNPRFFHLPQ